MRRPVPEELISLMTSDLLTSGGRQPSFTRLFAAVANMLLLDTYIRPSALLELTRRNVARPSPELGGVYGKHYAIVLAPQESGRTTKSGEQDDSLLVGDCGRGWLAQVMQILVAATSNDQTPLLPISLNQYEGALRASSARLGLAPGLVTPHVIRHTGASSDRLKKRRGLKAIKKRGTWKADKSVARYEKQGLILFTARELSSATKTAAKQAHSAVPALLLQHLRRQL